MAHEEHKSIRLPVGVRAELKLTTGPVLQGEVRNVSFGGVFVNLPRAPGVEVGEECTLRLLLGEGSGRLDIPLKCSIVHVQPYGLGMKFREIRVEHYEKFQNLMVMNSENPKKLLDELKKQPGLKII